MRIEKADPQASKGWYVGPWNSHLGVALGYANQGVDEPHLHKVATEIYCIARGTAQVRVEAETVTVDAGSVLIVEPGEAHTFLSTSSDYFHFVIHAPGLSGGEAQADKVSVPRSRLGL
jgi:mannose-6-phosphate isomerase-like protein (cupin superfamily)